MKKQRESIFFVSKEVIRCLTYMEMKNYLGNSSIDTKKHLWQCSRDAVRHPTIPKTVHSMLLSNSGNTEKKYRSLAMLYLAGSVLPLSIKLEIYVQEMLARILSEIMKYLILSDIWKKTLLQTNMRFPGSMQLLQH